MEMMMMYDDGHIRTGTVWTATTHLITACIGSGILALPWSVAQLGWIIGPIVLIACACITYYAATLLSDCCRTPDLVKGIRNHTYIDVVRSSLGTKSVTVCALCQFMMLWGNMIGGVIVTAACMLAVDRSNCYHYKGNDGDCRASGNMYMVIFGLVEIVLSQLPNMEEILLISVIAALMSFAYSIIALVLGIVKFASHPTIQGTLLGVQIGGVGGVSGLTKVWHAFQALGNIAFSYTCSLVLVEIQDTLKSPPAENVTMKKASFYGLGVTTIFNVSIGLVGYAAFGNGTPGNILTGFYEPFWLVDFANIAVIVHLVGAYQVFAQPIYAKYEEYLSKKYPDSIIFHKVYTIPLFSKAYSFRFTVGKLVLRTMFVVFTTLVGMLLPFFNAVLGLLGSISFWPLTVYFPVTLYIKQNKISKGERKWLMLQLLSLIALVVSVLSAIGSVVDIGGKLQYVKLFKAGL